MKNLGVKKFSESQQLIDPSLVYGTVAEQIEKFKTQSGVKDAELRVKSKSNLANIGAQLMFIIREIPKNKSVKKGDLLTSDDLHLGQAMSDAIRSGEVNISALQDFVVVEHTNNTNGAIYPLIVRPQEVADDTDLDAFAIKSGQTITKAYERNTADFDDVMSNLVL